MKRTEKIYRECAGFSLVETLVAVFILSVVSLISLNLMSSFADANQMMTHKTDLMGDIEKARSYLRDDLLNILERNVYVAPDTDQENFSILKITRGNSELAAVDQTRSAAQTVEYFLQDDKLIRRTYERPDATPNTRFRDYVLLRDIKDVSVRYYDGHQWQNNWIVSSGSQSVLPPRALEIAWSFQDDNQAGALHYINRFQMGVDP